MIFEISQKYASIFFQAVKDAENFAKSLNIDVYKCHIEFHENIPCKEILCYLIHFYEEIVNESWMDVDALNDICVFISMESCQTILLTQSR